MSFFNAEYLKWATDSFLLATAVAQPKTSIHTHMCYCDFEDCMEAIDRLDADVNSIENGEREIILFNSGPVNVKMPFLFGGMPRMLMGYAQLSRVVQI